MHTYVHFHFTHTSQKKLTLSLPQPEGQWFSDTNHQRIVEQVKHENTVWKKSLDHIQGMDAMVLELFLDKLTMDFSDQIMIGEQTENKSKVDKI